MDLNSPTLRMSLLLMAATLPAMAAEPFECRWTEDRIVIDGKGDEPAWKKAAVIDGFGQPWLKAPGKKPAHTSVRLLWDREWLYFLAEMEDRDVSADLTEHDADLWTNDVFELF